MIGEIACPGDRLGAAGDYSPGPGTYEELGFIYSTLVGTVHVEEREGDDDHAGMMTMQKPIMSVRSKLCSPIVPKTGDIITGKITRVQQHQAHVSITCVGSNSLTADFRGVIRLLDVRATQVDEVVMSQAFRPGDVIRAEVLGLGDFKSYWLSTARNDLGVVFAKSASSGLPMIPISWSEMQCPESEMVEKRKLAGTKEIEKE